MSSIFCRIKDIKARDLFLWVIGLLFVGKLYPGVYTLVWFDSVVGIICMFFCVLYITAHKSNMPNIDKTFLTIMGLWWLYFTLRIFIYNESESLETANSIIYSLIFIYFSITALGHKKAWNYFLWFHIFMLVLCFIGMGLLILGHPLEVISDYIINDGQRILNYGLFFTKTHDIPGVDELLFTRPCGFYDEPGSFAFMCFLVLMINKLYINNKKIEYLFLFGGFVTLSLAHFVTAFLYYCFFILKKKNIGIAIFVVIIILLFYLIKPSDPSSFIFSVWNMIFGRIEDFLTGSDDSRDYDASYKVFEAFFVTGGNQTSLIKAYPDAEISTIWFFLGRNGIIGSLLYLTIFIKPLRMHWNNTNKDGLKLLIILLANFCQRPYLHFPIIMFAIYLAFYAGNRIQMEKIQTKRL